MENVSLLAAWALGGCVTGFLATALVGGPLQKILCEIVPERTVTPFLRALIPGIFVFALYGGVGLSERYRYATQWDLPSELLSAIYSSGVTVLSFLCVLFFILLVSSVALVRARSTGGMGHSN